MLQEFFPVLDAVPLGDLWVLLIWGLGISLIYILALWLWLRRSPREGSDIFSFSSATALLGLFYAVKGEGYGARRFLMGTLVLIWGGCLIRRFWIPAVTESGTEEPLVPPVSAFILRACLGAFLSIPMAMLAIDPLPKVTFYEWLGLVCWLLGMVGHAVLESQRPLFEWFIWVAYFISALGTPYGAWAVLCPLVLIYYLKPFEKGLD